MAKRVTAAARVAADPVYQFICSLPKTEIHLHIEGLVSVDSIWALIKKHRLDLGIATKAALRKRFLVKSLNEFIDLFINVIQACFIEESDLDYLIADTRAYLTRNNIRHAEIFFAPTKLIKNGLDFGRMVRILQDGAEQLRAEGYDVSYIVDASRGFGLDNAMNNLDLTLRHRTPAIIGVGLGGAEQVGPAKDYQPVFDRARAEGLHVVAHAGEDVGPESIWDTLTALQAERIGHGISAIEDRQLMDVLRDRRIPLEVCPTSNLFTQKYAKTLQEHPIRAFFDHGMQVTVNTDDPTLFSVELNEEYYRLYAAGIFSLPEVVQLIKNGIDSAFLCAEHKAGLWNAVVEVIRGSALAAELSQFTR